MDKRYIKKINRYWVKVHKECSKVLLSIEPDSWFDLWHFHPDDEGKGNLRVENKYKADQLVIEFLQRVEQLFSHRLDEVQCFAIIKQDSAQSSIFVHSENPNGSVFPYPYKGVDWNVENSEIAKSLDESKYEVGLYSQDDEDIYFIRRKPLRLSK